jgi:predicted enzyme related to lactoylglutathione lyase
VTRPALRSILLGTTDPRRLRDWYTAALAPEDRDGFTEVTPTLFARRFGDTWLLIDGRDDVADKCPDPGRVILNFHVEDIRVAEARLVALGAVWVREPEVTRWGIIGTVLDPDGNYVQIVAPAPDSPTCLQRKEDHG